NLFRLGFCVVNGLRQEHGEQIERERNARQFRSLDDFKRRIALSKEELRTLAEVGALNCFAKHRRAAMWKAELPIHDDLVGKNVVEALAAASACLNSPVLDTSTATTARDDKEKEAPLLPMTVQERVTADYQTMNLTTGPHPMKLLRDRLPNIWRA